MPWTNERVDTLKKLWHDGVSASVIATKIGETTRNAVIGKVHRLGLAGRATSSRIHTPRPASLFAARSPSRKIRAEPRMRPAWQPRVATAPKRSPISPELGTPPDQPVTVQSLTEHTCRWPIGDPKLRDFHFCGCFKPAEGPYCNHHAALAFR